MSGGKGFFRGGVDARRGKTVWTQLPLGLAHVLFRERQLYMAPCQVHGSATLLPFFFSGEIKKVGGGVLFSGKISVMEE